MQIQLSSVGLVNILSDTIISVNGVTLNAYTTSATLVQSMPQTFFFENNSFGEMRLCCARIDGTPMTIIANDGVNNYQPTVDNYDVLFPGGFSTHPIHRPK